MYDYQINKTGTNIRTLREAFGETQLDLAAGLGFDSPAAVSMYESGSRGQNRVEVLERIAWHYRITLDELLHKDYSSLQTIINRIGKNLFVPKSPDAVSIEKIRDLLQLLFPMVCSDNALKEPYFRQAYGNHMDAITEFPWSTSDLNRACRRCCSYYRASLETIHTPESAVNILWWTTLQDTGSLYPDLIPALSKLCRSEISWMELVRRSWLRDELSSELQPDNPKSSPLPSSDTYSIGISRDFLLRTLYYTEKWHQLAEYYQALRYVLGITCSETDSAANMAAGRSMMVSLSQMGNQYAINLMDFLRTSQTVNDKPFPMR